MFRNAFFAVFLLGLAGVASAHLGHTAEAQEQVTGVDERVTFPAWTYWAEIYEHSAIFLIALAGAYAFRKHAVTMSGWLVIALSQVLTNMQHLMILYAGVWTAIIHHGTLLVGLALVLYGTIDHYNSRKAKR